MSDLPRKIESVNEAQLIEDLNSLSNCNEAVVNCHSAKLIISTPNAYNVAKYGPLSYCKFCRQCARKSPSIQVSPTEKRLAVHMTQEDIERAQVSRKERRLELNSQLSKIRENVRLEQEKDRKQEYDLYLQTPAWSEKRKMALIRDNYLCQGCRESRATQVHHLTYQNLFDELLFQLISLCTRCHQRVHGHQND